MIYDLSPEYDTAKSFYGKARVKQVYNNGVTTCTLYSYDTPVAVVTWYHVDTPTIYRTWSGYSATTQRHINEFLRQNCWEEQLVNNKWERLDCKHGWQLVPYTPLDEVA